MENIKSHPLSHSGAKLSRFEFSVEMLIIGAEKCLCLNPSWEDLANLKEMIKRTTNAYEESRI